MNSLYLSSLVSFTLCRRVQKTHGDMISSCTFDEKKNSYTQTCTIFHLGIIRGGSNCNDVLFLNKNLAANVIYKFLSGRGGVWSVAVACKNKRRFKKNTQLKWRKLVSSMPDKRVFKVEIYFECSKIFYFLLFFGLVNSSNLNFCTKNWSIFRIFPQSLFL